MANLISRHECTEMDPYAEPGLLSEASLTSCSPHPDGVTAQLKPLIDRPRPLGSPEAVHCGKAKKRRPLWRFGMGVGGGRGGGG